MPLRSYEEKIQKVKYQPLLTKPYKKEIEFCFVAKRLVEAGYGVLMYDLRNHGESDNTELGVGTGGKGERFDVIGAVEFISNEPSTKGKSIGLLSYCYAANTTFFAFEEDADFFVKSSVKALVALQPLSNSDFLKAMAHDKLSEVLHADFSECSSLSEALKDCDLALFCIGAYTDSTQSDCLPPSESLLRHNYKAPHRVSGHYC